MPPTAASTGTLSCTVAALVVLNSFKAMYQMAYPSPEASTPDDIAYQMPELSSEAHGNMATLSAPAKGTARKKFPAVIRVASPELVPRTE